MKNHAQKLVEKLFPDSFQKMKIEQISGSIVYSFILFAFIVCQVEDYQNVLKLSYRRLAFTSYEAFFKKK